MDKNKLKINRQEKEFNDQVEGRNAVLELLESDRDINKIYIADGEKHGGLARAGDAQNACKRPDRRVQGVRFLRAPERNPALFHRQRHFPARPAIPAL